MLKNLLHHLTEWKAACGWALYFVLLFVFLVFQEPLTAVPVIGILFTTVRISVLHLILISPIPVFLFHAYAFFFRGGSKKKKLKAKAGALAEDLKHVSGAEDLAEIVRDILEVL